MKLSSYQLHETYPRSSCKLTVFNAFIARTRMPVISYYIILITTLKMRFTPKSHLNTCVYTNLKVKLVRIVIQHTLNYQGYVKPILILIID